jgi:hypothetical protein
LKKFLVLPRLPSNKKNSSNQHNSYNKGPNLVFFSFIESPSNFLPTIKFPKIISHLLYHSNMPKTTKAKIWPLKTLGVKNHNGFPLWFSEPPVIANQNSLQFSSFVC